MSMELFEKVLTRQRPPGPVEKRLPKTIGTLRFASWVGWGGAALTLASGLFAQQLGMAETPEQSTGALLRCLPLVVVFTGCALYVQLVMLRKFLQAATMFSQAERQPMRMRWTPSKALVHKYVELFPPLNEDDEAPETESSDEPVARATVEKNLRRFDTSTWQAPVTVHLDPQDPDRRVLIDDGRFLYAGHILAKGEAPPSLGRRAAVFLAFAAVVGLLGWLEAWYISGGGAGI